MNKSGGRDFTQGPILPHLVTMTIPMIWGILAVIAMQLTDTYFIALLDDTDKLAAVSFTFPVTMLLSHLIFGLNIAMSSVISRLRGEDRIDDIKRVISHGLMATFALSSSISFIFFLFMDGIFALLNAEEALLPDIKAYMTWYLLGLPIFSLPVVANSAIRAQGDAMTPAILMTMMAVINVILDPFFIFGWAGLPQLEVEGAAIASFIANCCLLIAGYYVMQYRKKLLCSLRDLQLNRMGDSMRRLAHIAIPAGLANTIQPFTNNVILALVAGYGTEAVAAYGVVTRIEAFAFLIVISLSLGMSPIIGQNWGAQIYDRVHKTLNLALSISVGWSVLIAAILALAAEPVARLFSNDPGVIEVAKFYLLFIPITYACGNLMLAWGSAFNAMGMPKQAVLMIAVRMLVLTIPLAFLGESMFGLWGIFGAIGVTNVISGLGFHFYNRRLCRDKEDQSSPPQSAGS